MIRVTFKGIAARRTRTLLTAMAVLLGVAMISGALTLSDTMRHAANSLTSSSYRGTDAVVDARTAFDVSADQGNAVPPSLPAGLLNQVRAVPQVGLAVGDLTNSDTRIIDGHGKVLGSGPYFGVGFDPRGPGAQRLTPFRLQQGRFATAPDQVVIDAGTAAKQHVAVGGHVRVQARGPVHTFTVSGIATFGSVKSIGTATFAVFDLQTAQQLFGEPGRYDSILVGGRPGVAPAAVRSAIAAAIPPSVRVQTAAKQDRFDLAGLKQFVSIIEIVLLAFGGVAIFVGAFTIANTMSITVAQRSRELALLRTLGSSRRQVMGSVLLEALAMGALASLVGLFAGLGLGKALSSVMASVGVDLPQAGTVFGPRTIVVSLLVGIGVTVVAGLGPARRATRVAPVVAMREGGNTGEAASDGTVHTSRTAKGIAGLALALLLGGMFASGLSAGSRMVLIGPGCLLLFVGVALLAPRVAGPLASLLGRPAGRLAGSAGQLARGNAMRNPRRTASTASALMIGVALVVFLAVIASGMRESATGSIRHQIRAGYVVAASDGFSPIPASVGKVAGSAPGATASSLAQSEVKAFGHTVQINGVDPATFAGAYRFDWTHGSDASVTGLGNDGAIVDDGLARTHHLTVGSRFVALTPTGHPLTLVVRGIEKPVRLNALNFGEITVSSGVFGSAFPGAQDRLVFVNGAGKPALDAALAQYPGVKVSTPATFASDQVKWLASVLAIFYVLLALAVIVSLFGIVNTLVLSTFERTRELGMLRALGMSRRQIRRMVRQESVITALMGAVLGIGVGVFLAALVTSALHGSGLQFVLPVGSLVAFVVIAVLAGTLAAVAPARRAARLNPLTALSYE